MATLKKILVGVELLQLRQGGFLPPVAEAIKQAQWLAERVHAEITFFSALDLPELDQLYTPLGEHEQMAAEIELSARRALKKLVREAEKCGARAASKVAHGTGWVELMREAIDGGHDLVVVGTRDLGAVRRALFGSSAMKLLHHCPVPVWVTKPGAHATPRNVLLASDFSEVSDRALRLALRIGSSCGAKLHLMHVLESPYARLWEAGLLEARGEERRHSQLRAAVEQRLQAQLERVAGSAGSVAISIAEGTSMPDEGIAKFIESHEIDLLVMGTSARQGLAGAFLGNTAERLLTTVHCSLLAVKPVDFICPVPLESYREAEPTELRKAGY